MTQTVDTGQMLATMARLCGLTGEHLDLFLDQAADRIERKLAAALARANDALSAKEYAEERCRQLLAENAHLVEQRDAAIARVERLHATVKAR